MLLHHEAIDDRRLISYVDAGNIHRTYFEAIPVNRRLDIWKSELKRSMFRAQFLSAVVALIVTLHFFTRFLEWVELRDGVVLNDPILRLVEPTDFTWLTFGLIYLAVVLALILFSEIPKNLLLAIQAYTLLVIVRTAMMYLVPLNPAEGLIVLRDPVVQLVGNGAAPTKDLFFSGHTSTMFLFSLVSKGWRSKALFLLFALLVAACLVWQHVHYVVDVAVAPFVAHACYRAALYVQTRTLS